MDAGLSPLLRGSRNPVAARRSRPTTPSRGCPGVWGEWQDRMMEHYAAIAAQRPHGARRGRRLRRRAPEPARGAHAQALRQGRQDRRRPARAAGRLPGGENGEGTNGFAENLRYLAGAAGAAARHPRRDGRRARRLRHPRRPGGDARARPRAALAGRSSAFQADLEARGVADRVLTLVWTEFGRRPQENASGGTDHGAGGIAWVHGHARARRAAVALPGPQRLRPRGQPQGHHRLPRASTPSLLEQWLGTGADEVLPDAGRVGRVALVA